MQNVRESEERTEHANHAEQLGTDQQPRGDPIPDAGAPSAAPEGGMSLVLGEEAEDVHPAADAGETGGAAPEEEAEIEEIVRPAEEPINPQRIHVTKKRGDEWVIYEEDDSGKATRKLQRTVEDLISQIKVRRSRPSFAQTRP